MKVIFEADSTINRNTTKVTTHPEEKGSWRSIEEALRECDRQIVVINAKNDRNVQIPLNSIAAIQSEDRMCCVHVLNGEMYLLSRRLKLVEEELDESDFMRINNQTIINTKFIKEFFSTEHARIKVVLTNNSSYFVSRHYIKQFRGKFK
ncbi:LytTR family DNA-binding domain-containing protein [Paenibacillus sp. YPG26]|uniref:LytTR family DNA-binding domain-containing protein n=1 Tax=Paenibacillus sp. YPG26 TaxID=2878915 RepID=UPI00203CB984|nr:LytTR family DNA-binding domain-containing protein [Paenibacillus sp. YPG26]USB33534.1 LytTR family transcriptional regulator [Paenibacillus sp. YPG26]